MRVGIENGKAISKIGVFPTNSANDETKTWYGLYEKAKEIEWYDRYGLLQLLNQIIPDTMLKFQLLNSLPMGIKICPKCSEGIIINCRNGKTGHLFKACSLHCGHTEKFNTTE